jgi:hypothetical protein
VPNRSDVDEAARSNRRFSYSTISRICYSLADALTEAGLAKPRRSKRQFTRADMIAQLQAFVQKTGRPPKRPEWNAARDPKTTAGSATYQKEFGNWDQALLAAGVQPLSPSDRVRKYDDEGLLEKLREIVGELGRWPKVREMNAGSQKRKWPSAATYQKRFGSLRRALALCAGDSEQ